MMLALMMWRIRSIQEIFSGEIESLFHKDIKESLINETANPLISIAVTKIADKQIDFT
jgi:hypothetical protein